MSVIAVVALAIIQAPASDLELRAAYCARVAAYQQELVGQLNAAFPPSAERDRAYSDTWNAIETRRSRWAGYIAPRLEYLDLGQIEAAVAAASRDAEITASETEITSVKDAASARMRRCNDLSPLPY